MRALLLFLLLSGCAPATPPSSNQNRDRSAGDETPSSSLDGRWFVIEVDDDDVEFVLDVHGETGTVWEDDPTDRLRAQIARREDGIVELALEGLGTPLFLVPRGDQALAFAAGEDGLRIARRARPIFEELRGRWHLADPEDVHAPDIVLDIEGDRVRFVERETLRTGSIWGLAAAGPSLDVVVSLAAQGESPRLRWARFFQIAPEVYAVTSGGDDRFRVAHRPDRRPSILLPRALLARSE